MPSSARPRPFFERLTRARRGRKPRQLPMYPRPVMRGDCASVPRPCLFVACSHNLFLDYLPPSDPPNPLAPCGTLKLNFVRPDEMPAESSCAIDVAERGEQTLEEIATVMNMSDERVRQIDLEAREKVTREITRLRDSGEWDETEEENETMAAKKKKQASAAPPQPTGIPKGAVEKDRHEERLPVRIARDLIEQKAQAMAIVIREREEVLEDKREANAEFRQKLNFFDERLTELAASVESGTESRNVECIDFLTLTNEVITVRVDTGEVVSTRTAEADDLQETLPISKDADDDTGDPDDDEPELEEGAFPALKSVKSKRKQHGATAP